MPAISRVTPHDDHASGYADVFFTVRTVLSTGPCGVVCSVMVGDAVVMLDTFSGPVASLHPAASAAIRKAQTISRANVLSKRFRQVLNSIGRSSGRCGEISFPTLQAVRVNRNRKTP